MTALILGARADGATVELSLDALTKMICIIGRRGSGKTTTALVLAEEFIANGLPVVLLDPLGVHWGLRSSADGLSPGLPVTILGGPHGDLPLEEKAGAFIADLVVEQPGAYIIDFSAFESRAAEKRFATDFAERLYRAKAVDKSALGLIVDEADTFAPQQAQGDEKRMLGAFEAIARRGRVRGLGMVAITQRPAVLNKNIGSQAEILIAHQVTSPHDRAALKKWVEGNATDEQIETFLGSLATLAVGEAWMWQPQEDSFERLTVRRRRTFDSSATPKAGETRVEPRALAAVDIEQLRLRMAETIERTEQDDPKQLRARIVDLEARLSGFQKTENGAAGLSKAATHIPEMITCNHADELENLSYTNRALTGDIDRLEAQVTALEMELEAERRENDRVHEAFLANRQRLHDQVAELIYGLSFVTERNNHANTRADSVRGDGSHFGAAAGNRGPGARAHDRRNPPNGGAPERSDARPGEGVGKVSVVASPGPVEGLHRGAQAASGVGSNSGRRDGLRLSGRDTNDMKDEEVAELVRAEVAKAVAAIPGARIVVPPAEVIRKDYQQRAVARVMEETQLLDADQREVMRFMLGQGIFVGVSRVAKAISGNDGGGTRDRWKKVLDRLVTDGFALKGGTSRSEYKPRIREFVASELAAHSPTDQDIEDVYQAVLSRIAGAGVLVG